MSLSVSDFGAEEREVGIAPVLFACLQDVVEDHLLPVGQFPRGFEAVELGPVLVVARLEDAHRGGADQPVHVVLAGDELNRLHYIIEYCKSLLKIQGFQIEGRQHAELSQNVRIEFLLEEAHLAIGEADGHVLHDEVAGQQVLDPVLLAQLDDGGTLDHLLTLIRLEGVDPQLVGDIYGDKHSNLVFDVDFLVSASKLIRLQLLGLLRVLVIVAGLGVAVHARFYQGFACKYNYKHLQLPQCKYTTEVVGVWPRLTHKTCLAGLILYLPYGIRQQNEGKGSLALFPCLVFTSTLVLCCSINNRPSIDWTFISQTLKILAFAIMIDRRIMQNALECLIPGKIHNVLELLPNIVKLINQLQSVQHFSRPVMQKTSPMNCLIFTHCLSRTSLILSSLFFCNIRNISFELKFVHLQQTLSKD